MTAAAAGPASPFAEVELVHRQPLPDGSPKPRVFGRQVTPEWYAADAVLPPGVYRCPCPEVALARRDWGMPRGTADVLILLKDPARPDWAYRVFVGEWLVRGEAEAEADAGVASDWLVLRYFGAADTSGPGRRFDRPADWGEEDFRTPPDLTTWFDAQQEALRAAAAAAVNAATT